jgi:predicted CoA-binding protein
MGTGAATATMAIPLGLTASIIHSEIKKAKLEKQDLETIEKTTTMAQQVRMRNIWIKQGLSTEEVNTRMRQTFGENLVAAPVNPSMPMSSVASSTVQASIQAAKRDVNSAVDKTVTPTPAATAPVVIQDNRTTNNTKAGGGGSMGASTVRPTDNSFIRFQDKRQVRVL